MLQFAAHCVYLLQCSACTLYFFIIISTVIENVN